VNGRRDHAVILARGASRRMGSPKGLCRLAGSPRNLLETVLDLYAAFGLPTAVVTTPALATLYRDACRLPGPVCWIEYPAGGGTAATCLAAAAGLASDHTHLWLHPVDLPAVQPATLDSLRRVSSASPDAVVIPRHDDRRGHPVLVPMAPWRGLAPDDHPGEMRELIAASGCEIVWLDVQDAGVVSDVDEPGDLRREPDPSAGS
jgi:CTP:molybdopterin cytidylyltransferase MocA